MADVLAKVWAGTVHMLHGHISFMANQIFGDKAEAEFLLRIASLYGISPAAATFAVGTVTATGTNGSIIPQDTLLQVDGIEYRVTADATIALGTAAVSVQAILAGAAANQAVGVTLSFETPVTGVNTTVVVAGTSGLTNGFDQEGIEEVRDRYLLRLQEPPEGGNDADYERWALAVAGVTRVWVYRFENGLGTVVVRFVIDDPVTGVVTFPNPTQVAAVQAALDVQRPTTAEVTAAAPTALTVNFTIDLTPDTTALRSAVTAELVDLLRREAEPNGINHPGTILLSHIRTAIGNATGEGNYVLTVPAADVVPTLGQLAIMGTITWL